jgi:glycosyltransferase involved in cell wall biosynthesis
MVAKPRLLCVMQLPPPVHGVTAVNESIATSAELAARFDLDILPLRFADSVGDLGRVSVRKLARGITTGARLAWRLLAHRPDAVYFTLAPTRPAFYRDCAYVAVMKALRVRRVVHLHTRPDVDRTLLAWALRGARVIELAPGLHDDAAGDGVDYVANGIPDRGGEPARARRERPRVLFLSNMIADKGPLVLVEALARLAARGIAFEATFAGAPAQDCIAAFERAIATHGLGDRVRYVGAVYGDAKQELLRTHDVFALPTLRDAFPLVVLEAMQHALPVVATTEGALRDIVDADSGFLVPPRDVETLAARLETLLVDAQLRARMGTHARARYREHFTQARFERDLAAVLTQATARRS